MHERTGRSAAARSSALLDHGASRDERIVSDCRPPPPRRAAPRDAVSRSCAPGGAAQHPHRAAPGRLSRSSRRASRWRGSSSTTAPDASSAGSTVPASTSPRSTSRTPRTSIRGHSSPCIGGVIEFVGGIALAVGFASRLAGAAIFVDMMMAIVTVTWANGINATGAKSGYELNLALGVLALVVADLRCRTLQHRRAARTPPPTRGGTCHQLRVRDHGDPPAP